MTFAYIIGILTIITSLAVKIIGYPTQILQIHKSKRVDNISLTLAITSFITYVCWTIHGIIKNDVVFNIDKKTYNLIGCSTNKRTLLDYDVICVK